MRRAILSVQYVTENRNRRTDRHPKDRQPMKEKELKDGQKIQSFSCGQMDRQTDRQRDRQTDGKTDRQTD